MKEIRKKMDVICQDKAEAEEILIALMNNEHLNIQTLAAAEALRHNLLTDKAEALLEKVAAEEKGLIGFEAKMTLKVWRGEFPGNKL